MTARYLPVTDEAVYDDPAEKALMEVISKKWFALPLKIRKRWWDETNYSMYPLRASKELLQAVGIEP